jgi:hypothetical protein
VTLEKLFGRSPMIAVALFAGTLNVTAQTGIPRFNDYPVNERYTGKTAPPVLSKAARQFRTRLRQAAPEKPNFAGHFIVVTWGCGTECVEGAIIDAKTGQAFMLPFSLCCWGPGTGVDDNFKPVEFRLNSSLIVLSGARDEKDGDYGTRFYRFQNHRFLLVKTITH